MLMPTKKAAGGLKTTTATATRNATDFIAAEAVQTGTTGSFHAKPSAGIDRRQYRAGGHRDRILPGAEHTTDNAGNLSDNEVFSRLKFRDGLNFQGIYGFGAGSVYPQGRQHGLFHVSIPSPTFWPRQSSGGFLSSTRNGTMTTVNTTTTPNTGITSRINRQQAIENALATALFFIRQPGDDAAALRAATGRAIRAASMLKQACAEIQNGGTT